MPFATPSGDHGPTGIQAQRAALPGARWKIRVGTDAIPQVTILEGTGRLAEVAQDLDRSIENAVAEAASPLASGRAVADDKGIGELP
mgnify:CR=1 FL=1